MQSLKHKKHNWGNRALTHATNITNFFPDRGSATEGETHAAEYVRERLAGLSITDIRDQHFSGLNSIWDFIAFAFRMALFGHIAFWVLRSSIGQIPAALLSASFFAFSAHLLWRKLTFRDYPLRESLPHNPSQNVVGVMPPTGKIRQRVILVAHLDSHRAVWWFANDQLVRIYSTLSPLVIYGVVGAPLLYTLAAVSGFTILMWAGVALSGFHLLAWVSGITADRSDFSPGANDNASAVGTLLALAERLQAQPLQRTEVWLAFTGCEESGCDGMRALLAEWGDTFSEALFVDFELVGIGDQLVYLQSEGVVRKREITPEVEQIVSEVGADFAIRPVEGAGLGVFTEMGTVWEAGFEGVCLLILPGMGEEDGTDIDKTRPHLPEWHRMTDTPDHLQLEPLGRVHDFAWSLLNKVDQKV